MKNYKVEVLEDNDIEMGQASGNCTLTGTPYRTCWFKIEEYNKWVNGTLIQYAMPDLSVDDREFLISGVSPNAFDDLFKEGDV